MKKKSEQTLIILHVGADPEFTSPITFENLTVEITTLDNLFSVSQWVAEKGFPDAVICERELTGDNGFNFYKFWNNYFDRDRTIPFILLQDSVNETSTEIVKQLGMDDLLSKSVTSEMLASKIASIKEKKQSIETINNWETEAFKTNQIHFLKRLFDAVVSSVGLLIVSPILLLFIIAIKLESKGKAFYVSKRVGSGFKVFNFYKLRSMYANADKHLKELAYVNESAKEEHTTTSKNGNLTANGDRRITKVGYIIRKLKIDELPQLFNVLKGDMSIVGNRPLPIYEAELLTSADWTDRFHSVAGITGPWKAVTRRKLKSMTHEERNSLQNRYSALVKSPYSFWKDIWIIIRTIF